MKTELKLHDNWHHILRRSWSVRWITVAALFSGLEVIVPLFVDTLAHGTFAVLSFVASAGAVGARLLVQTKDGL